jgi:fatty-acyl-CoA synthase
MVPFGRRLTAAAAIARSVVSPFERPDRLPRALTAALPWGRGVAALAAGAAARYPHAEAIIDDAGSLTYDELWRRSQALAAALRDAGAAEGTVVGVMCRNHRGFVVNCVATAISGADLVLLNPGFAPPELADVVVAERIGMVLHDDDLADAVAPCGAAQIFGEDTLATMAEDGLRAAVRLRPPGREGRTVLLTSGTTGRPKGAARRADTSAAEGVAGMLARIPLRPRDVQVVCAPMFHAWGFAHLLLGIARSATTVVSRRFEPDEALALVDRHRARVMVVVPVMLQRMLGLDDERFDRHDLSTLEVVAASGSALGGRLATSWRDRVGPNLYNVYGSTEVALASIATPADLLRDPTSVGRPIPGSRVEILDDAGLPVPVGTIGRIFVGNAGRFEGYTSGGSKEAVGDLLSTGDLGHLDHDGLLHVDGRDDDMVVSGGENLYPIEVQELLLHHPAIGDVAVVGVPDAEFGQALAAYVVVRPGHELSVEDVRSHVRAHLAVFKVPRSVRFVDELPRTTSGKILNRLLRDSS